MVPIQNGERSHSTKERRPVSPKPETGESVRLCSRLVPIRPKLRRLETNNLPSRRSSTASARSVGQYRCPLPGCMRVNCNLRTHHQHAWRRDGSKDLSTTSKTDGGSADGEDGCRRRGPWPTVEMSIVQGGVDGLPVLPLDGLDGRFYRELFHSFFNFQYDRIIRIVCPPPANETQRLRHAKAKQDALSAALSGPVYCLHYIAAQHHQMIFKPNGRSPDQNTALLYGKMVKLLRDKLNNFDVSEIESLILVIFTLVMFDVSAGRNNTLEIHRNAVHHLVSSKGGLHNFDGRSIAFVTTLDRILSIFSRQPLVYASRLDRRLWRPFQYPQRYGGGLESNLLMESIETAVIEYCSDACRAIELLEGTGFSYDPDERLGNSSNDLFYFFYFKDCLLNQFCQLNAEIAKIDKKSRCLLIAAQIVVYVTLQDNYMVMISFKFADEIQHILEDRAVLESFTTDDLTMLTWILFVVAGVPVPWHGKAWAVRLLKQLLNERYGTGAWAVEWRLLEHETCCSFVWSESRFRANFDKVCGQVMSTSP